MKAIRKTVSILLAVILCASVLFVPAGAKWGKDEPEKKKLDTINIFVEGINACDLVDERTGASVFPPATDKIISAVAKHLPEAAISEIITNEDEKVIQNLVDGVMEVCEPCAMDENGQPKPGVKFNYQWPSIRSIKEIAERGEENHRVTYCYDWRLDMKTIATGLHRFIEYVMQAADVEKVNLVGFSMGGAAVMSFLKLYEDEYQDYVKGVVLLASGSNGSSSCGQPFSRKVSLDKSALINYVDGMLGLDLGSIVKGSLIHYLGTLSLTDTVIEWLDGKIDSYIDGVYEGMFMKTFGTMPGLWSLVPEEDYELARKNVPEDATQEFIDTIDWYHYQVALNKNQIINNIMDGGLRFGIIAKYGFPITPVTENSGVMSDSVIDTKYESFGATCADIGTTLGRNYVQKVNNSHNCISPDSLIDSSTCDYCDKTWFFKNCAHSEGLSAMMELFTYIFYNEKQPTVWDGDYPQYLIVKEDKAVALTENNYTNLYSDTTADDSFMNIFPKTLSRIADYLKMVIVDFFAQLKQKLTGLFVR